MQMHAAHAYSFPFLFVCTCRYIRKTGRQRWVKHLADVTFEQKEVLWQGVSNHPH